MAMKFDKAAPFPLHYQLTTVLREKLLHENWKVGDLFPKEKDLMAQYELSSTTVRRALSELVREGWLKRQAGKGTFVCKLPEPKAVGRLMGFFHEMTRRGLQPSAKTLLLKPIDAHSLTAEADALAQAFHSQPLFLIERLVYLDNKPAACIKSYWPYEYGSRLAEYDLSQEGVYEIAARDLSIALSRAEQFISAQIASREMSAFLDVPAGSPLLVTKRMAYAGDQAMEYSVSYYRADIYDYHVMLYQDNQNGQGIAPMFDSVSINPISK